MIRTAPLNPGFPVAYRARTIGTVRAADRLLDRSEFHQAGNW